MLIMIFVKTAIKERFTGIRTCAAGSGIMGVMVNLFQWSLSY
jgi:hypothetical protein